MYAARRAAEDEMDRRDTKRSNLRSRVPDFMAEESGAGGAHTHRPAHGVVCRGLPHACMPAKGRQPTVRHAAACWVVHAEDDPRDDANRRRRRRRSFEIGGVSGMTESQVGGWHMQL